MSIIVHQQLCIDRMLEPRSSEKRELKNRRAALRGYRLTAALWGYTEAEIEQHVRDIQDVYRLERDAEEA